MNSSSTFLAVAVVFAAVALMHLPSSEAVTCYDCTTAAGFGDTCKSPNNQTSRKVCSDACQTTVTGIASVIVRGCGTNSGCLGVSVAKVCQYTCNTDLCNIGAGSTITPSRFAALFFSATVILLSLTGFQFKA